MNEVGMRVAGRWFAYVAERGWNRTGLGVAFYTDQGILAGFRFSGVESAIRRGDLPEGIRSWNIEGEPPNSLGEMKGRLETLTNAMSTLKWDGGLPTLAWDTDTIDHVFRHVTGGAP